MAWYWWYLIGMVIVVVWNYGAHRKPTPTKENDGTND